MDFSVKVASPEKQRSDCVVVGVFEAKQLSEAAQALDSAANGRLSRVLNQGELSGRLGETALLHDVAGCQASRVLLVGCGRASKLDELRLRKIVEHTARALRAAGVEQATSYLAELSPKLDAYWSARHCVEATEHTLYEFEQFKTKKKKSKKPKLRKIQLGFMDRKRASAARSGTRDGQAVAKGVAMARDLGNRPANHCTPSYLADQAQSLQKRHKSITSQILSEAQMRRLGMGALLSVAQGSEQPAKLIVMHYRGGKQADAPYALVGKGVTFDTGGISIKPAEAMDEMKYDMCGAASVFGALIALAELKLPVNVVGVIPATENMPSGTATKPGDIFTSMSGQTVEVLNTDAEGRLILSDALTYVGRFKPRVVIDIATLTGACVIALGQHATGLLSNQQALADALLAASKKSCDRAWQLPLWEEYQQQLDSPFADMANVGGRPAGTITAGCFLSRYTEKYKWAHLDIAGTAWISGKNKGATGRPVGLLVQYLLDQLSASSK
jgi:leucyl aminopeptidase